MFRVGQRMPIVIVAPQVWSPLDFLIRLRRKSFRPIAAEYEVVDGIEVFRPKVFSVPGFFKSLDGWFMARGSRKVFQSIVKNFKPTIVDAHFVYPDGFAAGLLAKESGLPLTITIRGSKDEWLIGTSREPMLKRALHQATRLFAVSDALKQNVAVKLGVAADKVRVVGNGVDLAKFYQVDRHEARARLGIAPATKVMIGVGGLIPRKGFHRVIPLVKQISKDVPDFLYLIVGGGFSQGDMRTSLEELAVSNGVSAHVKFCGPQKPEDLKWFYGAADIFVLATEHEGWANVFLEAMACGLPVITTDVGGNSQVVNSKSLGTIIPYWEPAGFACAITEALGQAWDRAQIMNYAKSNDWQSRVDVLEQEFNQINKACA